MPSSRRRFLTAAAAAALPGCTGDPGGTGTASRSPGRSRTTSSTTTGGSSEPSARWRRDLSHSALTAPVVGVGPDRPAPALYVGRSRPLGVTPEDGERFPLYALSLTDGSTQWRADLPEPVQHGPVVKGERVYVATGRRSTHGEASELHALDRTDGSVAWTFDTETRRFLLPLAATEDTVVVGRRDDQLGPGESLYALAADDGRERWRVEAADAGFARFFRGTLFFSGHGGSRFRALDPATGEERWHVAADRRLSGPAFGTETVVVGVDDTVRRLALNDGSTEWERSFGFTVTAVTDAPGALADNLFVGDYDGRLLALSPLSGETRWTVDGWQEQFRPTARRSGGELYVTSRSVRRIDPVSGESLWQYDPDARGSLGVDPGPETVFVDGHRAGLVAALAPEEGTVRWQVSPDGYAGSDAAGDTVFVAAAGRVSALDGGEENG